MVWLRFEFLNAIVTFSEPSAMEVLVKFRSAVTNEPLEERLVFGKIW